MGRMWNPECQERKVQCPYCEWVFSSERRNPQCAKCHSRFDGFEYPYKTLDNRKEERRKHDSQLNQVQIELESLLVTVKQIRKDLRPLN